MPASRDQVVTWSPQSLCSLVTILCVWKGGQFYRRFSFGVYFFRATLIELMFIEITSAQSGYASGFQILAS